MKTINPELSIVMAVYNGEKYLDHTVRSVLVQSFTDFEFIIVDDCSKDGTVKKAESFNDSRIKILKNKKNLGQAESLQRGIEFASAKWIARIDADDGFLPGKLMTQMNYLKENPKIDLLGADCYEVNLDGKIINIRKCFSRHSDAMNFLYFGSPVNHISLVFNKEKAIAAGGYDKNFPIAADYHLWSRMMIDHDAVVYNIPRVLAWYRVNPNSLSAGHAAEVEDELIYEKNINAFLEIKNYAFCHLISKYFYSGVGQLNKNEIKQLNMNFQSWVDKTEKLLGPSYGKEIHLGRYYLRELFQALKQIDLRKVIKIFLDLIVQSNLYSSYIYWVFESCKTMLLKKVLLRRQTFPKVR